MAKMVYVVNHDVKLTFNQWELLKSYNKLQNPRDVELCGGQFACAERLVRKGLLHLDDPVDRIYSLTDEGKSLLSPKNRIFFHWG